jgi:DNA-directed RNA polymerase beta' subunit
MGELAVPEDMTKILTVPVRVNKYNFQQMQDLVNSGKVKTIIKPDDETVIEIKRFRRGTRLMHGDIIHRAGELITVQNGRELVQEGDQVERDGEFLTKLKAANRDYKIDIGYTVNRPLQDGDYVLLNRQPTLHKASMMAMKILIKPHKTLRMNLACTKPFNADKH